MAVVCYHQHIGHGHHHHHHYHHHYHHHNSQYNNHHHNYHHHHHHNNQYNNHHHNYHHHHHQHYHHYLIINIITIIIIIIIINMSIIVLVFLFFFGFLLSFLVFHGFSWRWVFSVQLKRLSVVPYAGFLLFLIWTTMLALDANIYFAFFILHFPFYSKLIFCTLIKSQLLYLALTKPILLGQLLMQFFWGCLILHFMLFAVNMFQIQID